jgi:C4-dicarboxylate-binding protein DctP
MTSISRRTFTFAAPAATLAATLAARPARAQGKFNIRVSLDTAHEHQRNVSFRDYIEKLTKASNGAITGQVFDGGALFSDLRVGKALFEAQVEMACPGTWTVTGFVPDADVLNVPDLYGRSVDETYKAIDGKTGSFVAAQLEKKLRVTIPGPWLTLGFEHWYATRKPLNSFADIKGLKVRNAGGAALAWRTRFFGAIPNTTAWPDVPLALSQGTFDGLITTNESTSSSKLWDAGVKYTLQDHQNVNCYVPMINTAFLATMPAELSKLVIDTWNENIPTYRKNMAASQERALATMKEKGIVVVLASDADIAAIRAQMHPQQAQFLRDLHMSPEIGDLLKADLGAAA